MKIVFMFTGKMSVFLAKSCHGKQMRQNTQQRRREKTYSSKGGNLSLLGLFCMPLTPWFVVP